MIYYLLAEERDMDLKAAADLATSLGFIAIIEAPFLLLHKLGARPDAFTDAARFIGAKVPSILWDESPGMPTPDALGYEIGGYWNPQVAR